METSWFLAPQLIRSSPQTSRASNVPVRPWKNNNIFSAVADSLYNQKGKITHICFSERTFCVPLHLVFKGHLKRNQLKTDLFRSTGSIPAHQGPSARLRASCALAMAVQRLCTSASGLTLPMLTKCTSSGKSCYNQNPVVAWS